MCLARIGRFAEASPLWMLRDIQAFNTQGTEGDGAGKLAGLTLREYFRQNHFAPLLLTDYPAPMGPAIWSAPASERLGLPPRILWRSSATIACCNMIGRSGALSATFNGRRRALTTAALLRAFFALPLVALKIVGGDPLGGLAALAQGGAPGAATE